MTALPGPWDGYRHLQAALLRSTDVADHVWGTEATMNRILDSIEEKRPLAASEIDHAVTGEARREHQRRRVRCANLGRSVVSPQPEDALLARDALRVIRSRMSQQGWSVLSGVAAGYSYSEMAVATGATANSLRIRVLRFRRRLAQDVAGVPRSGEPEHRIDNPGAAHPQDADHPGRRNQSWRR